MELTEFFKSVIDQDLAPVVLCAADHTVVYMNPAAAKRYEDRGGCSLVGKSIMDCHGRFGAQKIAEVVAWFAESPDHNIVFESRNDAENKDVYMVALRDESGNLIGYYEKHEYRTAENAAPYTMP